MEAKISRPTQRGMICMSLLAQALGGKEVIRQCAYIIDLVYETTGVEPVGR
jgi:hypothetical protein